MDVQAFSECFFFYLSLQVSCISSGKKYLAMAMERGVGPLLIDMEENKTVHRFAFHSHACAISPDEKHFCFNNGRLVLLYILPLLERQ